MWNVLSGALIVLVWLTGQAIAQLPFRIVDFGARCDGRSHLLASEFATLAAARQKFPFVQSLEQEVDWAAMQLAVGTAAAQGGGEVQLPHGVCFLSDTVEISTKRGLYAGDRVQLVGQGSGVTKLLSNVRAEKPVIRFVGTYGPLSEQNVTARGFSIFSAATVRQGIGLHLNQVNALGFEDIMISGFDRCVDAVDAITIRFTRARVMNCNIGVYATGGTFSRPNAWSFYDSIMTGHNFFAIRMDNPASLLIQGGVFENNGLLATEGLAATIFLNGNPMDGISGLVLVGGYFQLNRGVADVLIEAGAHNGAHTVIGAEFSRTSDRDYVAAHVHLVNVNEATKTNLTIMGTSFGGFNDYTASPERTAIKITNPATKNYSLGTFNNFYWSEIESPAGDLPSARAGDASEADRVARSVDQLQKETGELRSSLLTLNACFERWHCRWFGIR